MVMMLSFVLLTSGTILETMLLHFILRIVYRLVLVLAFYMDEETEVKEVACSHTLWYRTELDLNLVISSLCSPPVSTFWVRDMCFNGEVDCNSEQHVSQLVWEKLGVSLGLVASMFCDLWQVISLWSPVSLLSFQVLCFCSGKAE